MNSKLKKQKKGEIQFWTIMLIVGLIFFIIVVIIQTGVVHKFLDGYRGQKNETVSKLDCLVAPGSVNDNNNDGIDDTKKGCDKFIVKNK